MSNPYISPAKLAECKTKLLQGILFENLAGQLKVDPDHLAKLMKIRDWQNLYTTYQCSE